MCTPALSQVNIAVADLGEGPREAWAPLNLGKDRRNEKTKKN